MFIDSHAHIDGPEFDADRAKVIQRAQSSGVSVILNVGTGDPHSGVLERAVELSEKHDCVYTAIGTHPHDARLYDDKAEERIRTLVKSSSRIVAWGEIGLDFHYDNSPREAQVAVFRRQLRAAFQCNLPVIIHTREAEQDTIDILQTECGGSPRAGVLHCFSGTIDLAKRAVDLGFLISFSGIITFKKADDLRDVARQVPLDRLLIETDCPFLAPIPYRGKRNEPAYVVEVARCLSGIHGIETEEVGRITAANFVSLFKITSQTYSPPTKK
jgi:TatD DNase family protein